MAPEMDQAAGHHTDGPQTTRAQHRASRSRRPLQTLLSNAVHLANRGKSQHTVAVRHFACGEEHLHHTTQLEPFVRRALCGRGRYRVVPIVPAIPYGTDYPDTDLWVDEDGIVRNGDGSVRIPEQKSRASTAVSA